MTRRPRVVKVFSRRFVFYVSLVWRLVLVQIPAQRSRLSGGGDGLVQGLGTLGNWDKVMSATKVLEGNGAPVVR